MWGKLGKYWNLEPDAEAERGDPSWLFGMRQSLLLAVFGNLLDDEESKHQMEKQFNKPSVVNNAPDRDS